MGSKIPKANPVKNASLIPKVSRFEEKTGISFSFQTLEFNEYFNLDGTCVNWSNDLFKMLKEVSKIPKTQLLLMGKSTYRVHSHENVTPPVSIPEGVKMKDMYQIRIEGSKGGIHGIFVDDIFYVIWLDPLHNLYPNEHYGGLRKVTPGSTCCKDRDEELILLKNEIKNLAEENQTYKEIFEKA